MRHLGSSYVGVFFSSVNSALAAHAIASDRPEGLIAAYVGLAVFTGLLAIIAAMAEFRSRA